MSKIKKLKARSFLTGLFISSLGSTSFMISILTFLPVGGIQAAIIGLIIGSARVTGVLTNFLFGPIGDRINTKKLVVICEFGAMLSSILLYKLSFELSNTSYLMFVSVVGIRSFFTGLQQSSIHKIGKHFDDGLSLKGAFAKKINQVTFGSIFFAMFINLVAVNIASFQTIIIFDAISFLINGIILFTSTDNVTDLKNIVRIELKSLLNTWQLNKKYFTINRELYTQDILLAFVMMGANTLNVLLLFSNSSLVPFASGIFGLSVWLAPVIEAKFKPSQILCWLSLGLSIASQIIVSANPVFVLTFSLVRNLSYWLLFNHISMTIMANSPKEHFASISSGRNVTINLVGALGEFWTGLQWLTLPFELLWRALVALSGNIYLNRKRFSVVIITLLGAFSGEKSKAEIITIPMRSLKINTDPQLMEDIYSLAVNRQIYRGLVKFTSGLEIEPDLAESYQILDEGKRIRFKLRKTEFSDGTLITSQDVLNTFKRIVKINAGIKVDLRSIKHFLEVKEIDNSDFGVKLISSDIVDFELSYPDPFILKNLAAVDCSIIKVDKLLNRKADVFSGFYKIESNDLNGITLIFQGKDKKLAPGKIKLIKVDSDSQAIQLALKGELDSLEVIDTEESSRKILLEKGWQSFSGKTVRTLFLSANPKKLSLVLRKTIYSVINENDFSGDFPQYEKTYGLVPNMLPGALDKNDVLSAKVPFEKNQKPISLYFTNNDEGRKLGKALQNLFLKKGLKIELVEFPVEKYFDIVREQHFDLLLRSKYLDYPDGMAFLTYFKSNGPINTFNAGNLAIDEMIDKAQKESSTNVRQEFYKKIQIKLLSEFTLIPFLNGTNGSGLWSSKIKLVPGHPLGFGGLNFNEIKIDNDGK